MGRVARSRLLYDGCLTHVFSRSFEKRQIFQDEKDFEFFEDLLLKCKQGAFRIYHYCLMHTHFHMAVKIEIVELVSTGLLKLKRDYTYYYNKKHDRRGPLWRERFKSQLVENERYLYACGHYIENNPVKAGLVNASEEWPYSSSAYYHKKLENPLVDGYENQPDLPRGVDLSDKDIFTRGVGIGSGLFKLHLKEELVDLA